MRLPRWARQESEEDYHLRMVQMQQETEGLKTMTPTEVAGRPDEALYYCQKLIDAQEAGRTEEAEQWIAELLHCAPDSGLLRLIAAKSYRRLGKSEEALLQLNVALAVDPGNYAIHRHIAQELLERGDPQTARVVLERGWNLHKKHVRRNELEDQRREYFAILEGEREE